MPLITLLNHNLPLRQTIAKVDKLAIQTPPCLNVAVLVPVLGVKHRYIGGLGGLGGRKREERGAEEQGNGGLIFQLYLNEQGNPPSCGHTQITRSRERVLHVWMYGLGIGLWIWFEFNVIIHTSIPTHGGVFGKSRKFLFSGEFIFLSSFGLITIRSNNKEKVKKERVQKMKSSQEKEMSLQKAKN